MKKKGGYAAPIVISILGIAWMIFYFFMIFAVGAPMIIKIFGGGITLVLIGVMIYVCHQRIKEIRDGEEDDLGNY